MARRILRGRIVVFVLGVCLPGAVLSGCRTLECGVPDGPPYNEDIAVCYNLTKLKETDAANVLEMMYFPEYEVLSQTSGALGSYGQKKQGYKQWLTVVTFDEESLTARRKYLVIIDEKPKFFFVEPREYVLFDCEVVVDKEVVDEPYVDENARRIAVLDWVRERFRDDIDDIGQDNDRIKACGMYVHQILETALRRLHDAPALAAKLNDAYGVKFDHINLDKGQVQMELEGDVAAVEVKVGSLLKARVESPVNRLFGGGM